jgi:hypothetical protein
MKFTATILFIALFVGSMSAQQFSTMIDNDNIAWLRDFTVVTNDGKMLKAEKLSAYSAANGRLRSFSFKTDDGVKHKFKADEVAEVNARLTKFAKVATIVDNATKSIESAVTTDYAGIVAANLVHFNSVVYNKKKNKKALLQLINYGFDQKLKVYPDPNSESGTTSINDTPVTGGQIKAYFIVKGDNTFKVDKKSYKKLYSEIFGDCSKMDANPKTISIKNITQDILKYNMSCN